MFGHRNESSIKSYSKTENRKTNMAGSLILQLTKKSDTWGHELANSFLLFRLHSCFFTYDYKLFIQTKTTLFGYVAVRFIFLKDFPFNLKRFLGILQVPNIFGKFRLVSSV